MAASRRARRRDRGRVLGADEEADRRHALEQQPEQVAQPALRVARAARLRVGPDLLQLHGRRRPRRRLGLEEDHAVLDPEPRAPLLDLGARAPAEAVRVPRERVDPDLLLVRRGAGRHEQVEVGEPSPGAGRVSPGSGASEIA